MNASAPNPSAAATQPWLALYADGQPHRITPQFSTMLDMLAHALATLPDAPFIRYFDGQLSLREVNAAADALAADGISAEVIDAFSVKPLDGATILESVAKTRCVVTAEEHSVIGGLGSAVCELLAGADPVCVECVAVRDRFGKSGEFEELLGYFNIDATAIVEAVKKVRERAGLC